MTPKQKRGAAAALAVCAASAFVGWTFGYNFDERTPVVGIWVVFTLYFSIAAYGLAQI